MVRGVPLGATHLLPFHSELSLLAHLAYVLYLTNPNTSMASPGDAKDNSIWEQMLLEEKRQRASQRGRVSELIPRAPSHDIS